MARRQPAAGDAPARRRAAPAGALALALAVGPLGTRAHAGRIDTYGSGARAMGQAGAGLAVPHGPEDAAVNPASLAALPALQVGLGYGLYRSEFDAWPALYWDTNVDGRIDDTDTPLQLQADTSRDDGLSFALGRPLGERFGLAISGFLPRDRILGIHTFDASLPNYFLYENRLDRFDLALGFGWEQVPGLRVGGAVQIIARARYSLAVTLDLEVRGAGEADDELQDLVVDASLDAHEMSLQIAPGFAPVAALQWDVGALLPRLEGLQLAAAYRGASGLPVDVEVDLQVDATASEVGELEPLSLSLALPLELAVFDHYVPARLSLGAAWSLGGVLTAALDVHWTGWGMMQVNVARFSTTSVESPLVDLSEVEIRDANDYSLALDDTWGARTGVELFLPASARPAKIGGLAPVVRGGWGLDPSPLAAQGVETAFLDADRMMFALGAGVEHGDPFGLTEGPVRWDLWGQLHVLAGGSWARPDSPYTAGYPVGGTAIPIGGRLRAAGLQWSSEF